MKVIGAGLPRTATTTQAEVFEKLGFGPCYHMRDVLMDPERQLTLWDQVTEGQHNWEEIFGDAQSTCDWPGARYYKELADYYPDAKVILTVRSPESWVRSMRETVWSIYHGDSVMRHLCDAREVLDPGWALFRKVMTAMIWTEDTFPPEQTYDDASFGKLMERWNDRVKADIPADRLLVWHPADGWEPICEFLGVPVPDEEVPNTNDTAAFKEGITGGAIQVINEWWDARERPAQGLHGASVNDEALA